MASADFLSTGDVVLDLTVENKRNLIRVLGTEAATRLSRSKEEILHALNDREKIGSTAIGNGIALPHAQLNGSFAPFILFARLAHPIEFEAKDELPVDLVFVLLWPSAGGGLLAAMSTICRALRNPDLLRQLRAARSPEDVVRLVSRHITEEYTQLPRRPEEP